MKTAENLTGMFKELGCTETQGFGMDSRDELTRIFKEEGEDEVSRAKLYSMLHFDSHPADAIAKNIISLRCKLPIGCIVRFLNDTKKDNEWVSSRIQWLKDADRKQYKRRGCAPGLIDVIAEVNCIPPFHIYAPGTLHVSQIIDTCMQFISERPADLSDWEKNLLEARIKALNVQDEMIKASTLAKLTECTSLPSHVFFGYPEGGESYKTFRKSVMPVIDEIATFYFGDQLHDQMCNFVQKEFKKLVTFVDDEPDSFVNDFYIRFRQQVLDGNTAFSDHKIPFKSYLMNSFKYFLIDKVTILKRLSKHQSTVQEVRRQMDFISMASTNSEVEAECMALEKDVMLEAILCIPNEADRKILQSSLVDGLFKTVGYTGRSTSRALLRWSTYISRRLGESCEELPRGLQLQLAWYTDSAVASFLRSILRLEEITRKLGRNRQWLAKELCVSGRSLGKWIRLEVFPKEESIEIVKDNVARLRRDLGISDDTDMLMGEVDYA